MLPLRPVVLLLAAFSAASISAIDVGTLEKGVVRVFTDDGTGSGAIVANEVVLTNAHVVDGARHVQVISKYTGRELDAEVLRVSRELDLAVLQVDGLHLPGVTLVTRKPDKGEGVWAFGYPGASDLEDYSLDATVTRGVVSNFHQGPWPGGRTDLSIIQHDAAINPGNSGGPLFDLCGRVVGVNTAGRIDAQGTFLASRITEAIPELEHTGASLQKSDDPCTPSGGVAGLDEIARQQAQQAGQQARQAGQQARQAGQQAQQAERVGHISLITGLGVGLLALAAIILALRKPRRQIVEGVEHAVRLSRRYFSPSYSAGRIEDFRNQPQPSGFSPSSPAGRTGKPSGGSAPQGRTALILAGFDAAGKKQRILVPEQGTSAAQGGYVIGRQAMLVDHDVEAADISRRHARVIVEHGKCRIEDMNSANGTWVNNRRLDAFAPVPISPGDRVLLGTLEMQVSSGN